MAYIRGDTGGRRNQTLYPQGADAGVPPPEESHAFYTKVFEYGHAHGGVGYEVDFMSNLFIGIPEFRRSLDASTGWQRGMNDAGMDTNTTIQLCMMQPSRSAELSAPQRSDQSAAEPAVMTMPGPIIGTSAVPPCCSGLWGCAVQR